MTAKFCLRRIVRWIMGLTTAIVVPALGFVAWDQATYNFGEVHPQNIYRSGQMPAAALAQTVRDHQIKTVLNLRGSNPSQAWYREELTTTLDAGATHIDIAMSSCLWMSREQLWALIETLGSAEYPLLIHCQWGSERTSLACAFAQLLRPGSTLDDARAQFSIRYLFVRAGDGKVMAEHLDQYASWLGKNGLEHTAANFRRWAKGGFRPAQPGREQWPFDPYPLVVVTRPESKGRREPLAAGTATEPTVR
jgi:hypothetical protein